MFDHPLLERCTHIPVWVPYVLWLPVLAWLVGSGGWAPGWFALGVMNWTLFEYALHRFILHREFEQPRVHFLIHGVHHVDPQDRGRLVMPWPGVFTFAVVLPVLVWSVGTAFVAGFLGGYLFYEATHLSIHHRKPRTAWGRRVAAHHFMHHAGKEAGHWGISSPLWDWVFRG